ncbi:MAG: FUSC family protein [Pseudomonas sp.]
MQSLLPRRFGSHTRPFTWGSAMIAAMGCALPLLLGLVSGHPGFLWAAAGALHAAQAKPLHRFGMLRLLLLTGLGACSVGLGFWAASDPLSSLLLFAAYGLLLAWLQRFGAEAGKLGLGLALCLALGQGQQALGNLNNASAVSMLFLLGGLWVALLAFGLRGLHGLRTWPHMPRLLSLIKVLRRQAKRRAGQQWRLQALSCTLTFGLAGLLVSLAHLPHGYWLTMTALTTLRLKWQGGLRHILCASLASLGAAGLLILLGYSLQSPALMVAILLSLIALSRAIQASHYGLFMLQTVVSFVLLADSLSLDWHLVQGRLLNALYGVLLAMLVALLVQGLQNYLRKRQTPGLTAS